VASEVHAVAGDAAASLGALEQAGQALDQANEGDEASWIGIGTFNHAKLEAYHGVCYLQLGRPGDAVPALTRALDTLDPALKKHRCTALADLATGLIRLREVEEGCERASQSLTLAAELRHGVSIDRIRKLERSFHLHTKAQPFVGSESSLQPSPSAVLLDPGRFVPGGRLVVAWSHDLL
jgi:tetratricopeptide (TPR) repeat protein